VFSGLDLKGLDQTLPWLGGDGTVINGNTLTIANETAATFSGAINSTVIKLVKRAPAS
jgi:hypothetical protein